MTSRKDHIFILSLFLLLSSILAACAAGAPAAQVEPQAAAALGTATTAPAPSGTPVPMAAATGTAAPAATEIPTLTPTLFPMAIAAERMTPYPGSEITIEQELEAGSNYSRYYASYLSEGLRIYGLLTVPYGEMPQGGWPAIVFNHGYIPPEVYVTTERYVAYVDTLARSGYIVFRIDYRGHDRSEGEPTGAYGDPGYTADVLNALGALKQFGLVNPHKIGMWGHSMGGFLTLRAMVISRDIKAGVIWGGVVASYPDMSSLWRHNHVGPTPTPPARSRRWRDWAELYGSVRAEPGVLAVGLGQQLSERDQRAAAAAPLDHRRGGAGDLLADAVRAAGGAGQAGGAVHV